MLPRGPKTMNPVPFQPAHTMPIMNHQNSSLHFWRQPDTLSALVCSCSSTLSTPTMLWKGLTCPGLLFPLPSYTRLSPDPTFSNLHCQYSQPELLLQPPVQCTVVTALSLPLLQPPVQCDSKDSHSGEGQACLLLGWVEHHDHGREHHKGFSDDKPLLMKICNLVKVNSSLKKG